MVTFIAVPYRRWNARFLTRPVLMRMPETGAQNLLHAKVHREVIRRFGRFPYRNEALSRKSTEPEAEFVEEGGYGAVLERLSA